MDVRVFWTESAINQLEQIFDYYKYKASKLIAKKIVTKIVKRTILLEKHPLIGTKEQLLEIKKKEYRYLVEGNYKIIYLIEGNYIKIYSVFDCRLNPIKIIENNDNS